ncbi:MAG: C40 family peptidase, partial [Selenomonadaceae bacterium]|nr:C40 family peptidase [Selenomonadaceae bacterium]
STKGLEADGLVGASTYSALLGKSMPVVTHSMNAMSRTVVSDAMSYMGVPYVFGGNTPSSGFDCSGYVRYVFANAGIYLPRTADVQYNCGYAVSTSELAPGDLVFFETYCPGPSHVGIYVGDGNFVHASSSRGVTVSSLSSSYYSAHYLGARRVM